MLKTSTRFFKLAQKGQRVFSTVPRETFTGPKSDNDLLLSQWRKQKTIKVEQFPRKQDFTSDQIIAYQEMLENPNYSTEIDERKAKQNKIIQVVGGIYPNEELVPLQGEVDEQGNVKSYDEQKIAEMTVPGFMYHVDHKNFENSFQKIKESKILEARPAANGTGAFAYSLSGMYRAYPDWFQSIFDSRSHMFVFVPRNLDLKSFTLRQNIGEIISANNINIHLALTTEPASAGLKKITIHDHTLTAFLLAKFVENFQIGEKIIAAIFAEYPDKLGMPIPGDLRANAQRIFKVLNSPSYEADRKFNRFNEYINKLLKIHGEMCQFIDDNPKLSEKLKELDLLTAIKETPGKIVKLDASQSIKNADDKNYSPLSFTSK